MACALHDLLGRGKLFASHDAVRTVRPVDAVPVVAFVFALGDFELVDQPVQITACYAKSSCALRLAPAAFVQSSEQEPSLELPDFVFV